MNREILFRGKSVDSGEWLYGDLLSYADTAQIWYRDGERGKWNAVVRPETVGQYTGLTDKNGVKIFEGDIVKRNEAVYVVKYSTAQVRFIAILPNGVFNPAVFQNCKVIGNIHDNPKLLEDTQ